MGTVKSEKSRDRGKKTRNARSVKLDAESARRSEQKTRDMIVVLGMHRSGTSALTRVLNLLGCDMSENMLAPDKNNPAGYWEPASLNRFNEELLESAGSSWSDWLPFNENWYKSPKCDAARKRAVELLAEEYPDTPLGVMKDPRICRILPFWLRALDDAGFSVKFVIPIRNPLEVAGSLQDRDGFEESHALLLWLRHVLEAEAASRGLPRSFVSYPGLLDDWRPRLEKSQSDLGIFWPRLSRRVDDEVGAFLQEELRHQRVPEEAIAEADLFPEWLAPVYRVFSKWSREGEAKDGYAILDEVRREFSSVPDGFVQLAMRLSAAHARESETDKEVRYLRGEAGKRADRIAELDKEKGSLTRQLDEARKLAEERAQAQETARKEAQAERDAAGKRLKEAEARLQAAEAERAKADARAQDLETAVDDATRAAETARKEAQAERDAAGKRLKEAEARLQAAEDELRDIAKAREADATRWQQEHALTITALQAADERAETLASERATLQKKLSKAEERLSERDSELASLKDHAKSLEAMVEANDASLKETRRSLADAEAGLVELETALESLRSERDTLQGTLAERESALRQRREELADKEAAEQRLQSRVAALESEIETLRSALDDRDDALQQTRRQLTDRTRDHDALAARQEALVEERKAIEEERDRLAGRVTELEQSAARTEQEMREISQARFDETAALTRLNMEKDSRIEEAAEQVAALTRDLAQVRAERDNLLGASEKAARLQSEIATLQAERDALREDSDKAATRSATLEHEMNRLNERFVRRIADKERRIEAFAGQVAELTRKLSQFQTEYDKLLGDSEKTKGLRSEIARLQTELEDADRLKSEIARLHAERDGLHADKTEAARRTAARERDVADLKARLEQLARSNADQAAVAGQLSDVEARIFETLEALMRTAERPFLSHRRVEARKIRLLVELGLFDPEWYAENNPDVAAMNLEPGRHFIVYGCSERRPPSAFLARLRQAASASQPGLTAVPPE